jgi:phage-related baseplate assembly protein
LSNITEFADIPEYSVTGNLTLQGARDLVMDIYTENYKKVYAKAPPLYDSDPLTLTLKSMAMLYYMAMQVAERRALAAMLKSAEGAQLDNIGLPFGVKRNPATYATVTIRFTLSAEQKSVAMIPQGTRIRTGAGIYFATTEYAQINIGETSVDVLAKAEEVGAESNDIPPGVIDTLVDAIPFVAGAVNIDTSSGGADVESDDSLTRRIWLSPTTYSCAGPRDAYEFWAMSFRSDIENAIAISPRSQPCTAYIYFMLTGGKMPSEKDISEMETFMMNEARRPMTDLVICKAPEEVEYSIDFTYYIGASSKKNADIVQQNVAQAVQEYQDWQRSIGRDINPMELIYRLRAAGVKRVEIREPAFKVVESGADKEKALVQIPKLSGQPTVVYGGVEDD